MNEKVFCWFPAADSTAGTYQSLFHCLNNRTFALLRPRITLLVQWMNQRISLFVFLDVSLQSSRRKKKVDQAYRNKLSSARCIIERCRRNEPNEILSLEPARPTTYSCSVFESGTLSTRNWYRNESICFCSELLSMLSYGLFSFLSIAMVVQRENRVNR